MLLKNMVQGSYVNAIPRKYNCTISVDYLTDELTFSGMWNIYKCVSNTRYSEYYVSREFPTTLAGVYVLFKGWSLR